MIVARSGRERRRLQAFRHWHHFVADLTAAIRRLVANVFRVVVARGCHREHHGSHRNRRVNDPVRRWHNEVVGSAAPSIGPVIRATVIVVAASVVGVGPVAVRQTRHDPTIGTASGGNVPVTVILRVHVGDDPTPSTIADAGYAFDLRFAAGAGLDLALEAGNAIALTLDLGLALDRLAEPPGGFRFTLDFLDPTVIELDLFRRLAARAGARLSFSLDLERIAVAGHFTGAGHGLATSSGDGRVGGALIPFGPLRRVDGAAAPGGSAHVAVRP